MIDFTLKGLTTSVTARGKTRGEKLRNQGFRCKKRATNYLVDSTNFLVDLTFRSTHDQETQNPIERPLTGVELEIMNAVWALGECTVKDVVKAVAERRELAYTSVATMMKILEDKGALASDKNERAILYRPRLTPREHYGDASLKHLASHVFQGNPTSMVMRLLDDSKLSLDDLTAIRNLLDERLK